MKRRGAANLFSSSRLFSVATFRCSGLKCNPASSERGRGWGHHSFISLFSLFTGGQKTPTGYAFTPGARFCITKQNCVLSFTVIVIGYDIQFPSEQKLFLVFIRHLQRCTVQCWRIIQHSGSETWIYGEKHNKNIFKWLWTKLKLFSIQRCDCHS